MLVVSAVLTAVLFGQSIAIHCVNTHTVVYSTVLALTQHLVTLYTDRSLAARLDSIASTEL
eukprot:14531-Heterococcus_DN1.PRE.2